MRVSSRHALFLLSALTLASAAFAQESATISRMEIVKIVALRAWADTAGVCKAVGEIASGASLVVLPHPVVQGIGELQILHGYGNFLSAGIVLVVDDIAGAASVAAADPTWLQLRTSIRPGEASSLLALANDGSGLFQEHAGSILASEFTADMVMGLSSVDLPAFGAIALCTLSEMALDSTADRMTRELVAAAPEGESGRGGGAAAAQ